MKVIILKNTTDGKGGFLAKGKTLNVEDAIAKELIKHRAAEPVKAEPKAEPKAPAKGEAKGE